ncbi:hypothetical protein STSP2_01766 [Anaerohalosphaera lusitana]|uniref:DUF5616 domain-containing protein n=2 Tax=Anaerohalosphaera lusitana TaxID=1936003 RepID=A0A1U9NLI0_9BACT|nr:hypothetical protein STSP2_01766 [Anaerohalosphaera lusitana]
MALQELTGRELVIDGYNVLIGIEAALSGGPIFIGRDSCYRDIASVHGSYRRVEETVHALHIIADAVQGLRVAGCRILLDSPVSNSGKLKTMMRELAEQNGWRWEIELLYNPDNEMIESDVPVATSDSDVLDRCSKWINLARYIIDRLAAESERVWLVDLSGDGGGVGGDGIE